MTNHPMCPKFEMAFELLGKKWTGLINNTLLTGPKRFKDMTEIIPNMSDRILAERFKELEAAGILDRHVFPDIPVRIEYELTEKGKSLQPVMNEVQQWGNDWSGL
jgi:DNA-binding HxlR family transcriptional regulator